MPGEMLGSLEKASCTRTCATVKDSTYMQYGGAKEEVRNDDMRRWQQ